MPAPVVTTPRNRAVLVAGLGIAVILGLLWGTGALDALRPWLIDQQRAVQTQLAGAVRALRGGQPGALIGLLAVCFSYGVLHAAGPGHGKLLIGGYGVARRVPFASLAGIALLASLAQAAVAVVLVGAGAVLLGWTQERLLGVSEQVMAPLGTAAIAGVGLWVMARGIRGMRARGPGLAGHVAEDHHNHEHDAHCGHPHGPTIEQVQAITGWRDVALLVAGIALRPCSGALVLLILCFGLGVWTAGVAGAFAMGLGTAGVTIAVAALAVWAREGALASLPGQDAGRRVAAALPVIELVAGAVLAAIAGMLLVEAL